MSNSIGVWQKALVYLGLWEDQADPYDDVPVRDEDPVEVEQPEAERGGHGNVRPLLKVVENAEEPRVTVITVERFEDCEHIGAQVRDGRPVLFDLASVDRVTARRVLDFVSGIAYVQHAGLEKVASRAFVLTPEGTVLGDDARLRLEARGYRFADGA